MGYLGHAPQSRPNRHDGPVVRVGRNNGWLYGTVQVVARARARLPWRFAIAMTSAIPTTAQPALPASTTAANTARLSNDESGSTDPRRLLATIDALDSATHDFAGRRMDRSIKKALAGRDVAAVAKDTEHARGIERAHED